MQDREEPTDVGCAAPPYVGDDEEIKEWWP